MLKSWDTIAGSIQKLWYFTIFETKIPNGGDIEDGVEVDFFGFAAINPVALNGFSNPALLKRSFKMPSNGTCFS
jgi:hypothetical protein